LEQLCGVKISDCLATPLEASRAFYLLTSFIIGKILGVAMTLALHISNNPQLKLVCLPIA